MQDPYGKSRLIADGCCTDDVVMVQESIVMILKKIVRPYIGPIRLCIPFLFVALSFIGIRVVNAATYYVGPMSTLQQLSSIASSPGTLACAVANAQQGSVVVLEDGVYDASPDGFYIQQSNVTYMAQHWHGASIINSTMFRLWSPGKGVVDCTCQGIVFGPCRLPKNDAEMAHCTTGGGGQGWKFFDCEYTHCDGLDFVGDGLVEHCLFSDAAYNGFDVNGCVGFTMRNSIVRRSNRANYWPDNTIGNKCDFTVDITFDGLVSYDNVGEGLWFDTHNLNYVVKNCTFFGNHAGYTWNSTMADAHCDNEHDGACGFVTEANGDGNGYILNNTFYSNEWAGIFYHDTGGADGVSVTIKGNKLYDSPIVLNAQGAGDGNAFRHYGNGKITDNLFVFGGDQSEAWWTHNGNFERPPSKQGMVFDSNTYCPETGVTTPWATYGADATGDPAIQAHGLADLQVSPLLIEANGKTSAAPPLRGPLVPVYFYPPASFTAQQCEFPNSVYSTTDSIHQVNDDETPYIERAVAGKKAGQKVTLTVFGHTAFTGTGPFTCDVYDYSGRYLTLNLPDVSAENALDAAVPGYAVLKPYTITVKLSTAGEYGLTAAFPAGR